MASACRPTAVRRLSDGLLLALVVAVALLLGCYEMGDSDVWWHLRGGQWILEHGRVPGLDPFTFGSADRRWIDIHWSYEVVLALAHRLGGVAALIGLAACLGAGAFLVCLAARRREWPAPAAVLAWMPALVLLGFRLDPRPEIFSLLFLGCFVAVLWRADERPAWAWLLVPLQVLWANVQGLFILGPVVLGLFLAARGAALLLPRLRQAAPLGPGAWRRRWLHLGGAALAVAAACLVNPYFLDGARFPFDLFPKVAESGNIYKQYIDELMSPRDYVQDVTARVAGRNWFFLAFYFLLLLLPLGFLYPALWQAWRAGLPTRGGGRRRTVGKESAPGDARPSLAWASGAWFGGLAAIVVLLAASTLTFSDQGLPSWAASLGEQVPLALLLAGLAAALGLRRTRAAAALAIVGGVALAAWVAWLRAELLASGQPLAASGRSTSPVVALVALGVAAALVVRWGGDLFRILLAAAFAYLSLRALQNWSRFALVAGTVLAWNFQEWSWQLIALRPPARTAGWLLRASLAAALGLWAAALASDRYYVHTGEPRHFAFREQPLEFAHEAAVFAGRPGLPERALVYGLGQTGVYVYHNAPRCKPFLDGRLEMPARKTFETYVAIERELTEKDPRWQQAVARLGNPLLLLEHPAHHNAEAVLLTHPGWQCIYYDALASIFIPRGAAGHAAVQPVDLLGRHFARPTPAPVPDVRGAAAREEKALFNLAASLPRSPAITWQWRVPVLLNALDRAQAAVALEPTRADVWALRGNCYWNLNPDLSSRPPDPAEPWSLERGLYWAQATYCLRQAVAHGPDQAAGWRYLFHVYGARGMADAQLTAGEQWLRTDPKVTDRQREQVEGLRRLLRAPSPLPGGALPARVGALVRAGRPEAAARALDEAAARGPIAWTWPFAEQAAGLFLHLGRPADARRAWEQARDCPAPALRLGRLAGAFWVEGDYGAALHHFEEARAADPRRGEALWGLTVLHAELGNLAPARAACREGLHAPLGARQRADLEAWQRLLAWNEPSR